MRAKSLIHFAALSAAFFASLLFAGCASIPEPKTAESTLLYGEVQYTGKRGDNVSELRSGIKITIENVSTRKKTTLTSNGLGIISKRDLPCGTYRIQRIEADMSYESRVWQFWREPDYTDRNARFKIKPGVANLGVIRIFVDYEKNIVETTYADGYAQAEKNFRERHPDSTWSTMEWTPKAE